MFTQCVECGTTFQVTANQVSVAYGRLRCGVCGCVFPSLENLSDELDDSGEVPSCFHSERPPTVSLPNVEESPIDDLFLSQDISNEPQSIDFDSLDESDLVKIPGIQPAVLVTHRSAPRWIGPAMWGVAALLAIVGLLAQVTWFDGNRMAQKSNLRPVLVTVCGWLGCRIDFPHDLDKISLVSRNIEPHPSVEDALIISATMVNEADFTQGFPVIEITLSDFNGQRVAMRRFQPEEYLENVERAEAGLKSGVLLPLAFEVVDPGNDAVAFEFSFL